MKPLSSSNLRYNSPTVEQENDCKYIYNQLITNLILNLRLLCCKDNYINTQWSSCHTLLSVISKFLALKKLDFNFRVVSFQREYLSLFSGENYKQQKTSNSELNYDILHILLYPFYYVFFNRKMEG